MQDTIVRGVPTIASREENSMRISMWTTTVFRSTMCTLHCAGGDEYGGGLYVRMGERENG